VSHFYCYSECSNAEFLYAECHAESYYEEYSNTESFLLSVILKSVYMLNFVMYSDIVKSFIMLNVIILSVFILSVINLSVIMLSVFVLSVIKKNAIMKSVILKSFILRSVIMLSVIIGFVECRFSKCRYAECYFGECRGAMRDDGFMLAECRLPHLRYDGWNIDTKHFFPNKQNYSGSMTFRLKTFHLQASCLLTNTRCLPVL
jgi:hypothetical protein